MLVTVNGLPALCVNLNCDFEYTIPVGQITSQTFDPASKILTIAGSSLPTANVSVSLGGASCLDTPSPSFTSTAISCTLAHAPRAGSHKAEVRSPFGLTPNSSDPLTFTLVVSSVSPSSVNPNGGDVLTITGSGFPEDPEFVTVKFEDGSDCTVLTSAETLLTCKATKVSSSSTSNLQVNVLSPDYFSSRRMLATLNTVSSTSSVSLSTVPKVLSVDKPDVSPVLKQPIVLTLKGYSDELRAGDISVVLVGNSGYRRGLFVMSADNVLKTVTLKFNGAPMGVYSFEVYSSSPSRYGMLDSTGITLTTSSVVTSVSPSTGSLLGGTVLTITGTNFSSTILDQAVTIVINPISSVYCDIQQATTTQLICRIRKTGFETSSPIVDRQVVVVLAASEEASMCTDTGGCKFSFVPPEHTVTSLTQSFDQATNSVIF